MSFEDGHILLPSCLSPKFRYLSDKELHISVYTHDRLVDTLIFVLKATSNWKMSQTANAVENVQSRTRLFLKIIC